MIRRQVSKLIDNVPQLWAGLKRRLHNRRFWRNSGLLMLANVIGVGIGLLRTPAMAWLIPKEEVGMLGIVAAWQAFLIFLTWPPMLTTATYHYVAKGYPSAFTFFLNRQLRWSLLTVFGFLVSGGYWWWQGHTNLAILFMIAGITYPLAQVLAAGSGFLGAQENFVALFWYRIGDYLANFVGFGWLFFSIWWVSRSVTFFATNQLAAIALNVGIAIWLVRRLRRQQTPPLPPPIQEEMMRYGKHLTGVNAISVVQGRIDQLLVGTFLPLEVMADYTIAMLVYEQFRRLWSVYVTVRYPPLVRMPLKLRRRRVVWEGLVMWIGFMGLGLLLAILSYWLIPLILPPSYSSSLAYMYWLIGAFIAGVPGFFVQIYFQTEQDERNLYILRGSAAILGVILPALLMVSLGVYGVLIGRLASQALLSLVGGWLFWRVREDDKAIAYE